MSALLLLIALLSCVESLLQMSSPQKDTIIITGAARGFGKKIAIQAAEEKFPVIGLARKSSYFDGASEELRKYPECELIECDLESPESISKATIRILSRTKHVGTLIHTAERIGPIQPISQFTASSLKECLDVNLISVDYITRRLLPIMGDHKAAARESSNAAVGILPPRLQTRICVVTSEAAHKPIPHWSGYCVAKAGLLMWSRCASAELAQHGISVIALQTGLDRSADQHDAELVGPDGVTEASSRATLQLDDAVKRILPLVLRHPMSFSGCEYSAHAEDLEALLGFCIDHHPLEI